MALSLEQFSQQIAGSGLLSVEDVHAAAASLAAGSQPATAEQLARLLVKQNKLTAFQAKQIYAGKGRSLVLGNYVVLDKLGQGGMGTVLKARHRRMDRLVALKILAPLVTNSPEALRRFQREVKAAAKLEHPNIVTAHDADEAGGTHFLVMQYVDGADLSVIVQKQGPLSVTRAIDCVRQAARGLAYAHSRGVIHRDIKPSNLLRDREGMIKILDMGIARVDSAGAEQDQLTGTGQIMGTVDYMAPEQAIDTKAADARSDIYSLGVTLWYLLTGRALYEGGTVLEKLLAHQHRPVPSLVEFCRQASPDLEAVFAKMVAKSPASRYQTMTEVLTALDRCLGKISGAEPEADAGAEATYAFVPEPRGSGRSPATLVQAAVLPATQPTVTLLSPLAETDPLLQQPSAALLSPPSPRTQGKTRSRTGRKVAIAAAGAAMLLLAGVLITSVSKETDPPPELAVSQTAGPQAESPLLGRWRLYDGALPEFHVEMEFLASGIATLTINGTSYGGADDAGNVRLTFDDAAKVPLPTPNFRVKDVELSVELLDASRSRFPVSYLQLNKRELWRIGWSDSQHALVRRYELSDNDATSETASSGEIPRDLGRIALYHADAPPGPPIFEFGQQWALGSWVSDEIRNDQKQATFEIAPDGQFFTVVDGRTFGGRAGEGGFVQSYRVLPEAKYADTQSDSPQPEPTKMVKSPGGASQAAGSGEPSPSQQQQASMMQRHGGLPAIVLEITTVPVPDPVDGTSPLVADIKFETTEQWTLRQTDSGGYQVDRVTPRLVTETRQVEQLHTVMVPLTREKMVNGRAEADVQYVPEQRTVTREVMVEREIYDRQSFTVTRDFSRPPIVPSL